MPLSLPTMHQHGNRRREEKNGHDLPSSLNEAVHKHRSSHYAYANHHPSCLRSTCSPLRFVEAPSFRTHAMQPSQPIPKAGPKIAGLEIISFRALPLPLPSAPGVGMPDDAPGRHRGALMVLLCAASPAREAMLPPMPTPRLSAGLCGEPMAMTNGILLVSTAEPRGSWLGACIWLWRCVLRLDAERE